MKTFSFRSFKLKLRGRRRSFSRLLTSLEKKPPRNLQSLVISAGKNVWDEVDCLACANCCKSMTPTYSASDMKRISGHLGITVDEMKEKWLRKERGTGDWINKTTPCQFLDLKTNLCGIYEARPTDCAGFPHLKKRKAIEHLEIHKQNIVECPATFKMVEKMQELMKVRS